MSTLTQPQTAEMWSPVSWQRKPIEQSPEYPDQAALGKVVGHLSQLPPLVTSWEIERLREQLAEAAVGKRFILQGGDCAETLADCTSTYITNKLKILLQMGLVLTDGLRRPIVRIGRLAGQYAKPRSSPMETRNGQTLLSYYGDLINAPEFTPEARTPNPERMLKVYYHSALALNFIRALMEGGFADLHHPENWDLNFLGKAGLTQELRADYKRRVSALANAIEVMEAMAGQRIEHLSSVEFFTSHEGLSLPYEMALTRPVPRRPGFYDLSCHMPWIGERTRQLDGAHVEFFRGIRNPVGIKLGPKTTPEILQRLAETLDPNREPGRLVLICRFGQGKVRGVLEKLIAAMLEDKRKPVWICDPMHGNTVTTQNGFKTRHVDAVLSELNDHIDVHAETGSVLGGVHFELTAENVTECLGGASGVTEDDLNTCYQSLCDPRLNYEQAMEMAFAIARRMDGM